MLICGIDLIVSGLLFVTIYIGGELLKDFLLKEKAKISLDFNRFLISAIIQIVVGIILIVVYSILKKKFKKNKVVIENKKEELAQ